MRGLKLSFRSYDVQAFVSHLLQMRGLKLAVLYGNFLGSVASFTDAWIETTGVGDVE